MSSDTTLFEPIEFQWAAPDAESGCHSMADASARSGHAGQVDEEPVDDLWIEGQLARAARWRLPDWTLLCEAAERSRERRNQRFASHWDIQIDTAVDPGRYRSQTLRQRLVRAGRISILLHVVVAVVLACWIRPFDSSAEPDVVYVAAGRLSTDSLAGPPRLLEIDTVADQRQAGSGAYLQLLAASARDAGIAPPAPDVTLAAFVENDSGPVRDVGLLMVDRAEVFAARPAQGSGAEFFGVPAEGERFVFLVDCSVTMSVGTKWLETLRELTAAIERLGEDGWFYVIFFSEESQAMFDAEAPESHLLPASPENVDRLRRWLLTIKTGMSTQPAKSVKLALALEPDAIYLLSDGDFDLHDPTLDLLARENRIRADSGRRPVVVHTLCFLSSNLSGADKERLRDIAQQSGGRFVCVSAKR